MKRIFLGLALWLCFFAASRTVAAAILSEPSVRLAEDDGEEADLNGDLPAPPPMDGDIEEEAPPPPEQSPSED